MYERKNENKKAKISIKRLASNVLYVLKYAMKHNKKWLCLIS